MTKYVLTSDGRLCHVDVDKSELYHYGVPGMKWGVRNKKELKVAKRFAKAGKYQGMSDFYKKKGDDAAREYTNNARVLDRQAKAWDKKGHVIMAEFARRKATKLKEQGASARAEFDEMSKRYAKKAERSNEKASKYATKKRVNLGQKKINSILQSTRKDTTKRAAEWDQRSAEWDQRSREFDEWANS